MINGLWIKVHGFWVIVDGFWFIVDGKRLMVCGFGPRFMVCYLKFVIYAVMV